MSTRPSSVDELETAAEGDKYLQPYSASRSPPDYSTLFKDHIHAGRQLARDLDAVIQSQYENDAADLERAYLKYRVAVLMANKYLLAKSKFTSSTEFRQEVTADVESLLRDLEIFKGIVTSRYEAYCRGPLIPGAVPRFQIKRQNPRLAYNLTTVNDGPTSLVLPVGGAGIWALDDSPSSKRSSSPASSSQAPPQVSSSASNIGDAAQGGLTSGTIAAIIMAGTLIFLSLVCTLLYFLLYRPRRRRLRQRERDVAQDTESVLVADIAADDPPKKGFSENVAVAGPSRGWTNRRSGRDVVRDNQGVLVADIADDPPKKGFSENIAMAGPSRGRTKRRSGRDVVRDTAGVLVADVTADDPGFYKNVAVAGSSRDRTNRRSGFAKWNEEVEGVNFSQKKTNLKAPRLASHLKISGSESVTESVTGDDRDSIGNIVSLISHWKRRTLLVPQGAAGAAWASQALSKNDTEILSCLTPILQSSDARRVVLNLESREAQWVLEAIHDTLSRGLLTDASYKTTARRLMLKLSAAHDMLLPASLFITGVYNRGEHAAFAGGFGDVYKASYTGKHVALKRIRTFMSDGSKEQRTKFCREALVWQSLDHQFVVQFLGIDQHSFPTTYCMVSPWMEHGTVLKYLTEHGRSQAVLSQFLLQIIQGIQYLHSNSIIHGDIRGNNILIASDSNSTSNFSSTPDVHACLTDFGLATVIAGDGDTDTASVMTSSSNRAGSLRWFAPELLSPQEFGCEKFARTRATDVYAFACVCVELHTLSPPFAKSLDPTVIIKVVSGERPERPAEMSDGIWQLTTEGWAPKWTDRPGTEDIIRRLEN